MATDRTANEVLSRFLDEQEHIGRYVRLLHAKSTLHDRQVLDLNEILKRVDVDPLPTRDFDRIDKPYSPRELAELVEAIHRAEPEVSQTILGHEQGRDNIPSFGLDGPAAEHLDRLHEWVEYFADQLADDPEDDDTDGLLREALAKAEEVEEEYDEEDRIPPDALKALLSLAMEHARSIWFHRRIDAMDYALEQFAEIEVLARAATPDAEISVRRQGFLLLMTAFDAAVCDLMRIAFRNQFFELIRVFGGQDKVTMEEISRAGSFAALRDTLIEQQLKPRHLKDLIRLAQRLGVSCVDEAKGDKHVQLIELVLRRNVHVHNRGVVDERYLEQDDKGCPKYNLFGLKPGDVAVIDEAYLDTANRLCRTCVKRIADWVEAGAVPKK